MHRWAGAAVLFAASTAGSSVAQESPRFAGTLARGTPRTHALALAPGRYVHLLLERERADVALVVRDPGGRTLVEADTLVVPPGPRALRR